MTEPVKPRQDDRDAAWAIARFYLGNGSTFPDELRDGRIERHFTLDILATHAATAREEGRREGLREAAGIARNAVTYVVGEQRDLCDRIAAAIEAKEQDNGASHD